MIAGGPVQTVNKPERIRRVRLSASVGRGVGANQTARNRNTRRSALSGNSGIGDAARDVQDKSKINAVDRRCLSVGARLGAVVANLEFVDQICCKQNRSETETAFCGTASIISDARPETPSGAVVCLVAEKAEINFVKLIEPIIESQRERVFISFPSSCN